MYLWALTGLAVPLAIHFWSRKEGKTIKVGSIQFLKESDPKQASSVKLNEIWLLILRMLVITILVLIIARPVLKGENSRTALTYLIDPSLLQKHEMTRVFDTIDKNAEVRLLAEDFPEYSKGEIVYDPVIPDYWKLSSEMENINSDSIVVFTPGYVAGFKGIRPQTNSNINWIQIIPDESVDTAIAALRKGDEVEIISISGDHSRLGIKKEIVNLDNNSISLHAEEDSLIIEKQGNRRLLPLKNTDTLKVSIYHDEALVGQMKYIRSSLRAISAYNRIPVKITDISPEDNVNDEQDLLVWMGNSPIPKTNSKVLIWKPDSLAHSLIIQGDNNTLYYLTDSLDSENIVDEHFPEQLMNLFSLNKEYEEEITKLDRRVMSLEEMLPVTGTMGGKIDMSNTTDVSKYLWILLVILLIAERGLSAYRKQ